jgi:hypothetical protein
LGLARVTTLLISSAILAAVQGFTGPAAAASSKGSALTIVADLDDDDLDGRADAEQDFLPPAARVDLVALPAAYAGATLMPESGGERLRVIAAGKVVPWGEPVPAGAALQGTSVGSARLLVTRNGSTHVLDVDVRGLFLRDGRGQDLDASQTHASLQRTPPEPIEGGVDARYDDPDALRVVMKLARDARELVSPPTVSVESLAANGARLDTLARVPLAPVSCGEAAYDHRCFASAPLRLVADETDRMHPLVAHRSMRAEVGGTMLVRLDGRKAQSIRVLGPRSSAVGPIGRHRARVRPFVLRVTPGGAPSIGTTDSGALALIRSELSTASATWGQCGITLGDVDRIDVAIIDPPPSHLVAIGDDVGLPASGGELRLRVDKKVVSVRTRAGASPSEVASSLSAALERAGFRAVVSPNARIGPGAAGSVDVSVRRKSGQLASVEAVSRGAALTTDATLSVRIGAVDLTDGLQHFHDMDAVAGTLEERTLLKAIDDGDPSTIELVVVPSFAGGVRIGESFIGSDGSSLRNIVIVDRAGIRARKTSLTLAHELGHVLLDMPDHPDDYGLDTPTLLMDSDASDASAYGPRRLTVADCERAMRQSGPMARIPLLEEWPATPNARPRRPLGPTPNIEPMAQGEETSPHPASRVTRR